MLLSKLYLNMLTVKYRSKYRLAIALNYTTRIVKGFIDSEIRFYCADCKSSLIIPYCTQILIKILV